MIANKALRYAAIAVLTFAMILPGVATASNTASAPPIAFSPRQNVASVMAGAAQISSGDMDTCAVTFAGALKCWGANGYGQLGDGTTITQSVPVDVLGLSSGVSEVSAGWYHTCALMGYGSVKCWGWNAWGQVGDGSHGNSYSSPVNVSGLSGVVQVSAGAEHTCALLSAGGVKCWGDNYYGELGDGSWTDRYAPVDVFGLTSGVRDISSGKHHTCALMSYGGVKCWGWNPSGQIGNGSHANQINYPVDVSGLTSGVIQVSAGAEHTCALMNYGSVKCWGKNSYGQLGDNTWTDKYMPASVVGLGATANKISAGENHSCALTTSGGLKCWGWNIFGQLGNGSYGNSINTPVEVSGLASGVSDVSAGGIHTCALLTTGAVKCWGDNYYGELGDGSWVDRYMPVDVIGFGGGEQPTPTPTPTPTATPIPPRYFIYLPKLMK